MKKILSVLLAMMMLLSLSAFAQAQYPDGTYQGEGEGFGGAILVSVTVLDGKITDIELLEHSETSGISDAAVEQIPADIIEAQSVDVDVVAGATYTSDGIMEAVLNALIDDEQFADGTYEGEGTGFGGPIRVSVTFLDGLVTEILVLEHSETPGISDPAIEQIPAAMIEVQSTDVDVVAGATYTSEGLIEAVENALPQTVVFEDGTYEGEGTGFGGPILVSVTVSDGMITDISLLEHAETAGISDPAIEGIPAAIIEEQSADVDAVSGATYTSEGIMEAVENALLGE
ncbi:MAG: FMN-binding protein [Clostridiales bacterium]|nr:FMN-binding protein [Clostridiales bacterium]